MHYGDWPDEVAKVYEVEILSNCDGTVLGNVSEFSYDEYVGRVESLASGDWRFEVQYAGGLRVLRPDEHVSSTDQEFGKLIECKEVPVAPLAFQNLLIGERDWRKKRYKIA